MENKLLSDTRYYLRYMNMRRTQAFVLGRIEAEMSHLKELPSQARPIAELMERISVSSVSYTHLSASICRIACVNLPASSFSLRRINGI